MTEPKPDSDQLSPFFPKSHRSGADDRNPLMDFDLDLDIPWPLDQTPLFSTSDHLASPLWAFSEADDGDDSKFAAYACSVLGTSNLNSVPQKPIENHKFKILPAPSENPDGYCLIKEKMAQALRYIKDLSDQQVLAQVWAPVKNGDKVVLSTSGQPFVLDTQSNGLHRYRLVSLTYMFSLDTELDGSLGLPGRVFQQKLPEWTPNVQYYSSKEYSRLRHALDYNVQGTLALPVFDPSGQSCLGVLELIMTSPRINYAPEVDKVCKALQAVNLKSSEILDRPNIQICNEGRQNALAEILAVLTVVCETHNLPLAQTWVPCRHRNVLANGGGLKKSCTSFDGSCMGRICMSATEVASYVVDAHKWGFREACLEHHLQKGQGVSGRAFSSHSSCFCGDITQFCKNEYPLVHYALMFGLKSCFSICLRSKFTGDDEYILEFFLPPSLVDYQEQKTLLGAMMATMKQHFYTLKVASGIKLEEGGIVEVVQASRNGGFESRLECIHIPPESDAMPNTGEVAALETLQQRSLMVHDAPKDENNTVRDRESDNPVPCVQNKEVKKTSKRKRGKAEKSISLDVLQQYFAGSLKDAAKSLGVCPTTMKRICRQHGISRWPSRKINKVNRSLSKLKRVIDSVQGNEGTFGMSSLATSPLPVAVSSSSHPLTPDGSNQNFFFASQPSDPQRKETNTSEAQTNNTQARLKDQLLRGVSNPEELFHEQNGSLMKLGNGFNNFRTGSGSRDESTGTPTSHGSCQGSPANESNPLSIHHQEQCVRRGSPEAAAFHPIDKPNTSARACPVPDTLLMVEPKEPFGGMLIKDAGSSKDLKNLCASVADAVLDDQVPKFCWPRPSDIAMRQPMESVCHTVPHISARQEPSRMTIKATYKDDIIRFQISTCTGIVELREEVAKRLKLDVGTFDIKYMDDDREWVLTACDADLQECVDISKASGSNIIRLLVHDLSVNLGSSCESTRE
ncbi:Protein NLP7 [Cucurbita argyrosperma subsp. argyrosperma]|nr:Protein NLP7 [Cucurbita argyrosperma subsp. argyrosperma]